MAAQSLMTQQLDACEEQLTHITDAVMNRQDRLESVSDARRRHEGEAAKLLERAKQVQSRPLVLNTRLQLAQEDMFELIYSS